MTVPMVYVSRSPQASAKRKPCWSKHLQAFLFVAANDKEFVQLGDLEDFADLRIDVAQDEPAARGLDLLVQGNELAQGRARHVLHVAEVQQQFFPTTFIHQAEKLFADDLDIRFVQDLAIHEADYGYIADFFRFQTSTMRLRRHKVVRSYPWPQRALRS